MPHPAPAPILSNQAKTIARNNMIPDNQPRQMRITDVNGNAGGRAFPNQDNADAYLIQNALGISEING